MLFDPDAGRSLEEIIVRYWNEEVDADRKGAIEREARERRCSWQEVLLERMAQASEEMADPIVRQRLKARDQWRELPFGKDPLLSRKDGDI